MNWIEAHHFGIGILADGLTFVGACVLARDAFFRLRELKHGRVNRKFEKEFPKLNLTDEEWTQAVGATRWALAGFGLLVAGFLCQLLLRIGEAQR